MIPEDVKKQLSDLENSLSNLQQRMDSLESLMTRFGRVEAEPQATSTKEKNTEKVDIINTSIDVPPC